jgi:hypothetical protein
MLMVVLLVACTSSPSKKVSTSAIGIACDSTHPCSGGAECGTCGIATGQCTVECTENGIGSAVGCPDGTYCSNAWNGTSQKFCVRLCNGDHDCQQPTGNTGISCNDPYVDNGISHDDTFICNVSNSIGSTHTCQ